VRRQALSVCERKTHNSVEDVAGRCASGAVTK